MNTLALKNIKKSLIITTLSVLSLSSCHRNDDEADILPNEEVSDVVLVVKDAATGVSASYDYQINGAKSPSIRLQDGHSYDVSVKFMNGDENTNSEVKDAKDAHFLVYDFPNSDITLTRTDDPEFTRTDGKHVGIKTHWVVSKAVKNSAAGAQLLLTLFHESKSVSEASAPSGNGTVYGTQNGGSTDAVGTYILVN